MNIRECYTEKKIATGVCNDCFVIDFRVRQKSEYIYEVSCQHSHTNIPISIFINLALNTKEYSKSTKANKDYREPEHHATVIVHQTPARHQHLSCMTHMTYKRCVSHSRSDFSSAKLQCR